MTSDSVATNMICPKCGKMQPKADICATCGIVVAKLRPPPSPSRKQAGKSAGADPGQAVDREPAALPLLARLAIGAVAGVVAIGIYLLFTPQDMQIDEFVTAKKSSFHMRGFRIEGVVVPHRTYIQAQSSDGKELSSLKITGDGTAGYVTFDPDDVARTPRDGDHVRVTGSFQRVPYYDGRPVYKTMTMAFASSIEVMERVDNRQ